VSISAPLAGDVITVTVTATSVTTAAFQNYALAVSLFALLNPANLGLNLLDHHG
jgi:hypothetical protein